MSELHERLRDRPQVDVQRSELGYEERHLVRVLRVRRSSGQTNPGPGEFTSVAYLAGDERAAARRFVEANRDLLERIDFSRRNPVQEAVPREVYDWILHFLGERRLRRYRRVVYERRRDGLEWVIDRERYERAPTRRYTTREGVAARVEPDVSLDAVYEAFDDRILECDLREHASVWGTYRYVLEYFCAAGPFDCEAISVDGEAGVAKLEE
ncbi:hypothetical protein [Halopiger goleimassiliensis]|uniref:hypothetical protein n=1 Tax=Halopiger goleimassiliensis TaxID=1293048 RepID=UPI00067783B8|nr:hypothetical protein [Halopiger goleimassiliensis]